jgi:DNA-directed RNA polymerase specialized sigma24 family protein
MPTFSSASALLAHTEQDDAGATASVAPLASGRREALDRFYRSHHRNLAGRVYVQSHDRSVVADACGFAWMKLAGRPDIVLDRSGLAWLTRVAVHEAWRLEGDRETPVERIFEVGVSGGASRIVDPLDHALDAAVHRDRLDRFRELKPRERRDLFLSALGYRYIEIARMTASTYTAVNRRITEGRACLRPV